MNTHVAKFSGFCYGVNRAINIAYETLEKNKNKNVFMYGPIVHNEHAILDLKRKGIKLLDKIKKITTKDILIIRAHGITKLEQEFIKETGAKVVDATCPHVKKIHKIVLEEFKKGRKIIIIGDKSHSEVIGINGWCNNSALIIEQKNEIDTAFLNKLKNCKTGISVVCQTTFRKNVFREISEIFLKSFENIKCFDTICESTNKRQYESIELAKNSEFMFVIGSKQSSNTNKLFEACREFCENTFQIETARDVQKYKYQLEQIKSLSQLGVTAGASTPPQLIKEVLINLTNMA